MPRLDVPMATTSPPRIGCPHAPSVARVAAGMSLTTGRENRCRTRTIFGSAIALIYDDAGAKSSLKCPFPLAFCRPGPVYVDRSNGPTPVPASDGLPRDPPLARRLRMAQRPAAARPPGRGALPPRRAGPRAESLRGRAQPVQGDRGPPPGLLLRPARQRLECILRNYEHTIVIPETLFLLAEVNFREARTAEAVALFRRLAAEYAYTEWGRRAAQRLSVAR